MPGCARADANHTVSDAAGVWQQPEARSGAQGGAAHGPGAGYTVSSVMLGVFIADSLWKPRTSTT